MYLFLVTDAYSKKIMGYSVSDTLASTGAVFALKMALNNRIYRSKPLIHHSDRGLQYCCHEYQDLLRAHGIECSMTERYDPYQNAVAERINGILKYEFINGVSISDKELWGLFIENSIGVYNSQRPHYSCFLLTPDQMHKQQKIQMRTYKKSEDETNSILT